MCFPRPPSHTDALESPCFALFRHAFPPQGAPEPLLLECDRHPTWPVERSRRAIAELIRQWAAAAPLGAPGPAAPAPPPTPHPSTPMRPSPHFGRPRPSPPSCPPAIPRPRPAALGLSGTGLTPRSPASSGALATPPPSSARGRPRTTPPDSSSLAGRPPSEEEDEPVESGAAGQPGGPSRESLVLGSPRWWPPVALESEAERVAQREALLAAALAGPSGQPSGRRPAAGRGPSRSPDTPRHRHRHRQRVPSIPPRGRPCGQRAAPDELGPAGPDRTGHAPPAPGAPLPQPAPHQRRLALLLRQSGPIAVSLSPYRPRTSPPRWGHRSPPAGEAALVEETLIPLGAAALPPTGCPAATPPARPPPVAGPSPPVPPTTSRLPPLPPVVTPPPRGASAIIPPLPPPPPRPTPSPVTPTCSPMSPPPLPSSPSPVLERPRVPLLALPRLGPRPNRRAVPPRRPTESRRRIDGISTAGASHDHTHRHPPAPGPPIRLLIPLRHPGRPEPHRRHRSPVVRGHGHRPGTPAGGQQQPRLPGRRGRPGTGMRGPGADHPHPPAPTGAAPALPANPHPGPPHPPRHAAAPPSAPPARCSEDDTHLAPTARSEAHPPATARPWTGEARHLTAALGLPLAGIAGRGLRGGSPNEAADPTAAAASQGQTPRSHGPLSGPDDLLPQAAHSPPTHRPRPSRAEGDRGRLLAHGYPRTFSQSVSPTRPLHVHSRAAVLCSPPRGSPQAASICIPSVTVSRVPPPSLFTPRALQMAKWAAAQQRHEENPSQQTRSREPEKGSAAERRLLSMSLDMCARVAGMPLVGSVK
ncbi:hypothetical protein PAPYR_2985 [Paratrimastix pyriformis]|uniref:Uncharacterized protein n=1 Tax=Paratrimastix pyriformis TaxID=342808 RepID=A0ABQ8UPJ2_9EUKA|nr:hypothetical protein PAPYR_2985 [Paratrimastix pyriformis]